MDFSENQLRKIIREEIATALGYKTKQSCNHCYCMGNYNQPPTTTNLVAHKICCKCGDRMVTGIMNSVGVFPYLGGVLTNPYHNDSAVQGKLF